MDSRPMALSTVAPEPAHQSTQAQERDPASSALSVATTVARSAAQVAPEAAAEATESAQEAAASMGAVLVGVLGGIGGNPAAPVSNPIFEALVAAYRRTKSSGADEPSMMSTTPMALTQADDGSSDEASNLAQPEAETLSVMAAAALESNTATGDASAAYEVTSDWGSGYVAKVTVAAGESDLNGWTVEFDSPDEITNIWSGEITSHVDDHYVVQNAAWNGTVDTGQSTTFGFQATTDGTTPAVSNLVINGQAVNEEPTTEPPAISITNATIAEGDSGTNQLGLTVSLSEASTETVTVAYTTTDGTATAGQDYTATSGTLTFGPGQTTQQISVGILGDTDVETTETFNVTLSNPTGATLTDATATATITNDDVQAPLPTLNITNATIAEGDSGTNQLGLTVSLSEASTETVTVAYTTTDGTATAGQDYTATSGTLTFGPGQTTQQISVGILGDTDVETTETFNVTLSNPTGATLTDATATATITNDDTETPSTGDASADYSVTSDWGSGYVALVTVTAGDSDLDGWTVEFDSPDDITSVWSGEITSHVDDHYVVQNAAWNGTVAAGLNTTFGFQATTDGTTPTVSNFVINGQPVDGEPTTEDPTISISDARVSEGDSGTTQLGFTVILSEASTDTVTVVYTTSNGTATAGQDYTATSGTLTFDPGQTTQQISIDVLGDSSVETTESLVVTLSDANGATIADATATGVIIDNDGTGAETGWADAVYSPYVDMGLYPPADLVEVSQTYGVSYVNLAFMQADADGNLAWAGLTALEPDSQNEQAQAINASIAEFQAAGGEVAISMGGVSGTTIAEVYASDGKSAEELAAQYEAVIETYNVSRLDFDIESGAQYDQASIELRSEALAIVQEDYPDVEIWYTLPVLPSGLTDAGLNVVESALAAGVELDGVNIMAMDYGESAAPTTGPNAATMGEYSVEAAESTYAQLSTLYAEYGQVYSYDQLGVTVMIGVNDITTEVFTTEDAATLLDYANESGLGMISLWSITRDNPGTIGQPTNYASGTDAESGAYSDIFNDYGVDEGASANSAIDASTAA